MGLIIASLAFSNVLVLLNTFDEINQTNKQTNYIPEYNIIL